MDFSTDEVLQDCFERLYSIYDENFKPSRELYGLKLKVHKSMVSTCEPTPHCFTIENTGGAITRRNKVLESNQNITNDSFINITKES